MFYTYLLKLSNKDYYVGTTDDLRNRFKDHNNGKCKTTKKFRPLQLVWYCGFNKKELSINFEKYLKSSSGKAFRNKHLI